MTESGRHAAPARSSRRGWLISGLVALGLLAFVGGYLASRAGDGDGQIASPTSGPASSAAESTEPASTPVATTPAPTQETSAAVLEDGLHFVQPISVSSVADGSYQLTFDLGYFYTGAEAFEYAEDNDVELVNDYVIVNENPKLRTMPFAEEAAVLYIPVGTCCELVDGNLDALAESVNGTNPTDLPDPETTWWFITVKGGRVEQMVQQYLP